MKPTSLVRRRADMRRRTREELHGGSGNIAQTVVLDDSDIAGRSVNFIFDNVLPPGASIGPHDHTGPDEEYYMILAGRGQMSIDGRDHDVGAGDISAVFQGGRHELRNTGDEPLRLLVISVAGNRKAVPE